MYDRFEHSGNYSWGWIGMAITMTVIIIGIVLVVHYLLKSSLDDHKKDSATEVLKTRYAKGEIDKKEFDQKYKDLKR